jgi:ribosomal protein S18 acetylase RimI-like enzyme
MIREATLADSRTIAEIHVASWRYAYVGQIPDEVLSNLSVPDREIGWRKSLSSDRLHALVYEDGGKVTGFISFGPTLKLGDGSERRGEVYTLYLLPDYQHRGIGRALWRAAIEKLRANGYSHVSVGVLEINSLARRFYERCGCAIHGAPEETIIEGKTLCEVRYVLNLA